MYYEEKDSRSQDGIRIIAVTAIACIIMATVMRIVG